MWFVVFSSAVRGQVEQDILESGARWIQRHSCQLICNPRRAAAASCTTISNANNANNAKKHTYATVSPVEAPVVWEAPSL